MSKVISLEQAVSMIPDGATVGIGGFIGFGHPQEFRPAIAEDLKEMDARIFRDEIMGLLAEKE